jgi:hypothetical protein
MHGYSMVLITILTNSGACNSIIADHQIRGMDNTYHFIKESIIHYTCSNNYDVTLEEK